ncbi:hypothetical protein [Alteromonas lipolytica]|uniref:Serine kinase n=1 Tax=Alteromonas lipolytica TaxID=1856405 RepID=A0A1E8FDM0_9ALTE|nr:hypothetical protein [Alteromonas lipolytica]OFI33856.1 hypothetical protein BFC17_20010 [Alteromonas lipolytica]GGF67781.1 hypothetical protein GCM10011338_19970 [Alteromonas lipolytica]
METDPQQELITLSAAPLHGVTLSFTPTQATTPYQLNADFGAVTPTQNQPVWQLTDKGERYHSVISLNTLPTGWQLSVDCEGQGIFELNQDTLTINWQPGGTGPAHYLQTMGISLYLELKGHLCLHANTLVKNNQAHLFLAPSRTGKSTLTALLTTLGYQLTTDDMAALYQNPQTPTQYQVYPSWAKVRLWPDSAQLLKAQLTTQPVQQKKVHQRFAKQEISFAPQNSHTATPVKAMYYLNRVEQPNNQPTQDVTITPIAPSAALIILMQNSMLGDAYRSLGIEKQRITALAQLLQNVPFYKVTYPSGLEQLPDIAKQIDTLIS